MCGHTVHTCERSQAESVETVAEAPFCKQEKEFKENEMGGKKKESGKMI